jgi:hypothetical protein
VNKSLRGLDFEELGDVTDEMQASDRLLRRATKLADAPKRGHYGHTLNQISRALDTRLRHEGR